MMKGHMTDVGGKAILNALQLNSNLKTLDLSFHNISEELVRKMKAELKLSNRYWKMAEEDNNNLTLCCRTRLVQLCCATIFRHQELYDVSEVKQALPEELYALCFSEMTTAITLV